MTSPEFPYSFSDGLASPDMSLEKVSAETQLDKAVREIAALDNVHPDNPAYRMVENAIKNTLNKYGIVISKEVAGE